MRLKNFKTVLGLGVLVAASAHAHHSFVIYDGTQYNTYTGVFTKDNFNAGSHANFEFQVTGEDGKVVTWKAETQAPRLWPEDRPKFLDVANIGEEIVVTGWPLRNGSPTMWIHTMRGVESGISFSVDNRIVQGASMFTFPEGELSPEGTEDLPEFTPDGNRVFTEDGLLTRHGAALLQEIQGVRFDPPADFDD